MRLPMSVEERSFLSSSEWRGTDVLASNECRGTVQKIFNKESPEWIGLPSPDVGPAVVGIGLHCELRPDPCCRSFEPATRWQRIRDSAVLVGCQAMLEELCTELDTERWIRDNESVPLPGTGDRNDTVGDNCCAGVPADVLPRKMHRCNTSGGVRYSSTAENHGRTACSWLSVDVVPYAFTSSGKKGDHTASEWNKENRNRGILPGKPRRKEWKMKEYQMCYSRLRLEP